MKNITIDDLQYFVNDEPQVGDFVYNAMANSVDRVAPFDHVIKYNPTRQCTVKAALDYGHKVIDINEFLKSIKVMGTMTHSKYSDAIILEEVEKGDYKYIQEAFKRAADKLGVRKTQIQAKYYQLRNDGIKYEDVADYTQVDVDAFDPGDSEKIQRSYPKGLKRPKSPEGYGKPWKDHQTDPGLSASDPKKDDKWKEEQDNLVIPQPAKERKATKEEYDHFMSGLPHPSDIQKRRKQDEESYKLVNEIKSKIEDNLMKTVLVAYTNIKTPLSEKEIRQCKLYAFNTPSEMKRGDVIESDSYSTPMQVVEVLDKPSEYYNRTTGELSDVFTSTEQRKLATLIMREDDHNTVYAKFVPVKK